MAQGCWFEGTLMFNANFEIHEGSGKPRAYFTLKVPANYQKQGADERWDSLAFEAWEDAANACADLKKGDRVVIIGRAGSYSVDKGDGKKKYNMKLTAERVWKIEAPS